MHSRFGVVAAMLLATAVPATAGAQDHCSQETLDVRGTPVTVAYCVIGPARAAPGGEIGIPVQASYGSPGGSFGRREELLFISGEGSSRVVENLALGPLGLAGQTLHLTLVYAAGAVRVDGALLTPGAITIK